MVITKTFTIKTNGETDIYNVTPEIVRLLGETKLKSGIAVVIVPGSTASLKTIEFEEGAVNDLKSALERIAPRKGAYDHNKRWDDGNGFAHVRAALMGQDITVPFNEGTLILGTWQQVILIDFDNRPRVRTITIQFIGEK